MWYISFLELMNGDIYVGSTNDLRRRLESNQNNKVLSTKAYCPVNLRTYIAVETEGHARTLETYFKSGSGKAFAKKRFLSELHPSPFGVGVARHLEPPAVASVLVTMRPQRESR